MLCIGGTVLCSVLEELGGSARGPAGGLSVVRKCETKMGCVYLRGWGQPVPHVRVHD